MTKIFHNPHRIKLPKSQHGVEEFSAKGGIILCSECGACYYKKHWHRGIEKLNLQETEKVSKKDTPMKHAVCPACRMIANKQYEGRIVIKNFPKRYAGKLEELVSGFGRRAYERDPMDRVISVGVRDGHWEITTTENELANKLARKIKDTFNKVKSRAKFAPEPSDVAEITIEFQS